MQYPNTSVDSSTLIIPIIIVNWNGVADTISCIDTVLKSKGVRFCIHLVDNGSDVDQATQLKARYKDHSQIQLYLLPENLGFAKANILVINTLLQDDYPYIALLNNDTEVDPDWLRTLVATARQENAQMVSSKLIRFHERNRLDNVGHQMLNTGEIIPIGYGEPPDQYTKRIENFGSCAAATLYETNMLRQIGSFDPFFSTGYEDAELGARAVIAGYRSVLAPNAVVYHKVGSSIGKIFDAQYATMIQESIWYTYFKLMPWSVILLAIPFILLKLIIVTFLNLITFRFTHLKIIWTAVVHTLKKNRLSVRSARRKFAPLRALSGKQILTRQRFFLGFDIRRFWRIYIQKKPSSFDRYGTAD